MAKNYKVLKLRSGDSVVAELIENSKSHIPCKQTDGNQVYAFY